MRKSIFDKPLLVIGGTTKAATTSLFHYLADHPNVCASVPKETRFFLDKDYPLPSKLRLEDGIDKYKSFFHNYDNDDKYVLIEATPDYLYSQNTPQRIKQYFPDTKFIFILRNPISRLVSWYKYAKQIGVLQEGTSFDAYISMQQDLEGGLNQHPSFYALKHGCYYSYLDRYFNIFDRANILVLFYESMNIEPFSNLHKICSFVDLNSTIYKDYDFKIFNESFIIRNMKMHRIYDSMKFFIRQKFRDKPHIRKLLRNIRFVLEPLYVRANTFQKENAIISEDTKEALVRYYSSDIQLLEALIGMNVTWKLAE